MTLPAADVSPSAAAALADSGGSVQFIGTATVRIRYQGLTILTAPNFLHRGEHVQLGYGLRSQRLTNPALELSQLPPIDLVDLALLHLDGTRVFKMIKVTMDGKDGVQMLGIVAPRRAIPIHFNDYDVFKSPLEDFQREVQAAGLAPSITYLKLGEIYRFVDFPLK